MDVLIGFQDLQMSVRVIEKKMEDVMEIMRHPPDQVRNVGTLAHVDHGKTTTSDSLLMGAGLLSPPKVAGKRSRWITWR